MSVSPSSGAVTAGSSTTSAISTAVTGGNAQQVSLSITGLPTGATASFNPSSISTGSSSVLTLAASSSTPVGTYPLVVRATGSAAGRHRGKQRRVPWQRFIRRTHSGWLIAAAAISVAVAVGVLPQTLWHSFTATAPCSGVVVAAGGDVAALVAAYPGGTTFCLQSGVYRVASVIAPKADDVVWGQPGTVLSGGLVMSGWAAGGSSWVASGYLPAPYTDSGYNPCQDQSTNLCKLDEWLFRDDVPLRRVASAAAVVPGTFYTDYTDNLTYVGDDPAGHLLEISRTRTAITSTATNVTVRGLRVEEFATKNQHGAVVANADNWTVSDCDVRFNHGAGIYDYGNNFQLLDSHVHHNGTLGVGVNAATGVLVSGNELDHNNTDGGLINDGENGGYKSTHTTDTIRGNNVHDNLGMGLWFDTDDTGTLVENNTITGNASSGVCFEISYSATIRNNTVTGNGLNRQQGDGSLYYGAGIVVSNGNTVEVYGNTVTGNDNGIGAVMQNRGSGSRGTWVLTNVYVHDNTVQMSRGITGIQQSVGDPSYFTSKGNHYANNHYTLDTLTSPHFAWDNNNGGVQYWQTNRQDTTGTFTTGRSS